MNSSLLNRPPCEGRTVEALLGHVLGLSQAFRDAAVKAPDGLNAQPPQDAPPEPPPRMFGQVVEVPQDALPLDRALGLAGRDPGWTP